MKSSLSSVFLSGWVVSLSLTYSALDLTVFLAQLVPSTGFTIFTLYLALFAALFAVFAYASWRQKRWGYLGAAISSLAFLLSNLGDPTFPFLFSNTANANFTPIFTVVVATSIALIYGVYGYYLARRGTTLSPNIPRATVPAILGLGFVIGGVLIGALAGGTQLRLLSSGGPRDVTIVVGADDPSNGRFYDPATLAVSIGKNVVWFNGDPIPHTVTSTGNFDSGPMDSGDSYEYTFSQAGTFDYYCVYHPWMAGQVVVQAS